MKHEIYTFRASTLADALRVIRDQLGPDAAVLETRRVSTPVLGLFGGATVEVTAATGIDVPSRLPSIFANNAPSSSSPPRAELEDYRRKIRDGLKTAAHHEASLVERLAAARGQTKYPSR